MSMRKVLLGTTALVAAGLLLSSVSYAQDEEMAADEMMADEAMAEEMMEPAGPVSLSIGGAYRVAIGSVSGDDGAGEPLANRHTTSMGQTIQINLGGETTLDNGMTVGVTVNMDTGTSDNATVNVDETFVTIGGAFGSLQLGSVESAQQQNYTWAPNPNNSMGLDSPHFTFVPASGWYGRYNDGIGVEDALKIVYHTPTINGLNLSVSYAPDDTGSSSYGKNGSDDKGQYKDHIGFGGTFSQEFAGGSIGLTAGYETYDAETPSGMSCASIIGASAAVQHLARYTLAEKLHIIMTAFDNDGVSGLSKQLKKGDDDVEVPRSSELLMAVDKAKEVWGGAVEENPLVDDSGDALVELGQNNGARQYDFYTGEVTAANAGAPFNTNCEPETVQFGVSLGFGDFSVGGGWRETDVSDTASASQTDFAASWSSGPLTVAGMWAQSNKEADSGSDAETTIYGLAGNYALGQGIDLQAQLDIGEYDAAGAANEAVDFDWVQFMIGTSISF